MVDDWTEKNKPAMLQKTPARAYRKCGDFHPCADRKLRRTYMSGLPQCQCHARERWFVTWFVALILPTRICYVAHLLNLVELIINNSFWTNKCNKIMFFSIKLQKFFPSNSNPVFRFEEQIPRIPSVFRDRGKSLALHTSGISVTNI